MSARGNIPFPFQAQPWRYSGQAGWYFVSLPLEMAQEIRTLVGWQEEGWGRLKVKARVGKTTWETAIWFDTKAQTYLLPLKASIRTAEGLNTEQVYGFEVWV
jgi:hypothetical protein